MALDLVARSFAQARGDAGVLVGGRSTLEDAYAYGKFARVALATNNIDFRIRAHSAEEAGFLSAHVAGRTLEESVTYQDLESAPAALLVALEPEEESPIIFLRLRKAARFGKTTVLSSAPFATRGLQKMGGSLLRTVPGSEAALMDSLSHPSSEEGQLLRQPGAVILLGERLSEVAGGFAAAVRLAEATGACLAWVPRRAGDRGAVEAGALPGLLPGGRPVADPAARREVESVWGASIPASDGRDAASLLGPGQTTAALLVGGVELSDLPNPAKARAAIEAAGFVVSLEIRHSGVTELADVVFPVAPVAEKPGTFLDWEGRERVFDTALRTTGVMPDQRVLHAIAARWASIWAYPTQIPHARRYIASAIGTDRAPPRLRSRQAPCPHRHWARQCCRVGECCSTTADCKTASPTWRVRHGSHSCVCLPRPLPRSAPTTAITLRCRLNPVPSHYRWRSPNSRLEQSGSRSIHRVARSTKRSALPRVPW